MSKIILTALNNCASKYAKGFPRWEHLWQEKTSVVKQSEQIADELVLMGYVIVKIPQHWIAELSIAKDTESLITTYEGE